MKSFLLFFLFFTSLSLLAQDKPEGLFINSKAFDFKGKDQNGNEISLKDLRKKGEVVVIFYRGNWCPYCNKSLSHFQDSLQYIMNKGAQLVAITPETAEGITRTVEKTKASFPILHDEDMKWAKAYQVSYKVDERTFGRYKNAGIDLLSTNNQKVDAYLPVPAVYVINKEGSVTYRYFDADFRKRVSVREILNNL